MPTENQVMPTEKTAYVSDNRESSPEKV